MRIEKAKFALIRFRGDPVQYCFCLDGLFLVRPLVRRFLAKSIFGPNRWVTGIVFHRFGRWWGGVSSRPGAFYATPVREICFELARSFKASNAVSGVFFPIHIQTSASPDPFAL